MLLTRQQAGVMWHVLNHDGLVDGVAATISASAAGLVLDGAYDRATDQKADDVGTILDKVQRVLRSKKIQILERAVQDNKIAVLEVFFNRHQERVLFNPQHLLELAVKHNKLAAARWILRTDRFRQEVNWQDRAPNPIHLAAAAGKHAMLGALLDAKPEAVDFVDSVGKTALCLLTERSELIYDDDPYTSTNTVVQLVKHGANIKAV